MRPHRPSLMAAPARVGNIMQKAEKASEMGNKLKGREGGRELLVYVSTTHSVFPYYYFLEACFLPQCAHSAFSSLNLSHFFLRNTWTPFNHNFHLYPSPSFHSFFVHLFCSLIFVLSLPVFVNLGIFKICGFNSRNFPTNRVGWGILEVEAHALKLPRLTNTVLHNQILSTNFS